MTDAQLSIPERSALLALMTFVTTASNTEIRARFGFTIDKAVREQLEAAGYLKVEKRPRTGFHHTLEDEGWARCREELAAPLPGGVHRAHRLLHGVLGCLDQYLSATGLTLADFLDPQAKPDVELGGTTDERLRAAYDTLASRPGAWVGLAALREALPDVPRDEFDAELLELDLQPHVSLIPEVNQKALTPADRTAAIHVGGEDKHLLQIRPT